MDSIEARAGFPPLSLQQASAAMPEGVFYTSPTSFPLEWTQGEGKRGRGVNWGTEETEILLDIYSQRQQSHAGNIHIYKLISDDMSERGYYRSPAQCKTRIHTLKRYYGNSALEGQGKGGNSSRGGDSINLADCSNSSSTDVSSVKRPRLDVSSADADVDISQVKIERIDEDDDEYANLEVTMGNPAVEKRATETFTPSFGQFCAGVLTPPSASAGASNNIDQTSKYRSPANVLKSSDSALPNSENRVGTSSTSLPTSAMVDRARSNLMAHDGVVTIDGSGQGISADNNNSKRRDSSGNPAGGKVSECIDVEDSQPSSNRSSGSLADAGAADPEDERRSIELARANWTERMKAQGLYKTTPSGGGSGGDVMISQSDVGPRIRQPLDMLDQQRMRGGGGMMDRGMMDHGGMMMADPMFSNSRGRMFPNNTAAAASFPPQQNPPNLPPLTQRQQRGVVMAAGGGNPGISGDGGWTDNHHHHLHGNSHCANQTAVMEKLIGHLQHMQNRYVELEVRRMDLEEKRLDMERRKMEADERQKKEEREHHLRVMQLVTRNVQAGGGGGGGGGGGASSRSGAMNGVLPESSVEENPEKSSQPPAEATCNDDQAENVESAL